MSFVGLRVPSDTARLLGEIEVPGVRVPSGESHITMLYLGKEVPIEVIAKAMTVAHGVTTETAAFTVRTSLVTCFPKNEDGVPIICKVESEPLHFLQRRLKAAFQLHGVPFSDKYPEYKPHVTLAYADEPIADRSLSPIEWGAHELVLWGGDEGDRGVIVTFPLTINMIARRVAQRFSTRSA